MKTLLPTTSLTAADTEAEAARIKFIEDYGVFVEKRGQLPRMAGRIMGQLLLGPETLQSQADLSQALQASPGAISTTLRILLDRGYVERVSVPGVRKDYYRMADEHWARSLEGTLRVVDTFLELTARGLEVSKHYGPEAQQRMREMHDLARIEEEHFRSLATTWADYRAGVRAPSQ